MEVIMLVILYGILVLGFYTVKMHKMIKCLKCKNKKAKMNIVEVNYMQYRFQIPNKNLLNARFALTVSLINSFIIILVFSTIMLLDLPMIVLLLISFVLLMGLIYSIYELYGRILVKKGYQNEHK